MTGGHFKSERENSVACLVPTQQPTHHSGAMAKNRREGSRNEIIHGRFDWLNDLQSICVKVKDELVIRGAYESKVLSLCLRVTSKEMLKLFIGSKLVYVPSPLPLRCRTRQSAYKSFLTLLKQAKAYVEYDLVETWEECSFRDTFSRTITAPR
jgi:hypothetical protein